MNLDNHYVASTNESICIHQYIDRHYYTVSRKDREVKYLQLIALLSLFQALDIELHRF